MAAQNQGRASTVDPRSAVSAHVRHEYREEARRGGDTNQLWVSAWSKFHSINQRFFLGAQSAESLEWDMHDLWYLYFVASMNISEDKPELDRLVLQIIQAREQGSLIQNDGETGSKPVSRAVTSDGIVWADLPFLVKDMTDFWVEGHAGMSSAQRLSFAKFLAKLAAAGVADDRLFGIALVTLGEALETPRGLGTFADHQQGEDSSRLASHLTVAAYLPCANAWLSWAGRKIIQLSDKSAVQEALGEPGSSLDNPDASFSTARWMAWLMRLEGLATSFRGAREDQLADFATGMMNNMLITVEETGGQVTKDLALAYANGTMQYHLV